MTNPLRPIGPAVSPCTAPVGKKNNKPTPVDTERALSNAHNNACVANLALGACVKALALSSEPAQAKNACSFWRHNTMSSALTVSPRSSTLLGALNISSAGERKASSHDTHGWLPQVLAVGPMRLPSLWYFLWVNDLYRPTTWAQVHRRGT